MSVVSTDLVVYKAATMAPDFTTTSIGGAVSTNNVTGSTVGECFFTMGSNTSGGGNKTQYQKLFYQNNNSSTSLTSSSIWLSNGLLTPGTPAIVSVVSTSSSDNSTYKIRNLGFDNSGTPVATMEELQMNGTSAVTGVTVWSVINRSEYRNFTTNVLSVTIGTVAITVTSLLGNIPIGLYSATNEIQMWLVGSLGDSGTTTNALTAPSGSSFSLAVSSGTALAVANSGTLTNGNTTAQGMWFQWTLNATALASPDIQVAMFISGQTT